MEEREGERRGGRYEERKRGGEEERRRGGRDERRRRARLHADRWMSPHWQAADQSHTDVIRDTAIHPVSPLGVANDKWWW